ncbi:2' cyclic ADP-D-ribose synthase AbTIR-like [Ptychodera flava]|uniref:2' cyclic ADP-D-ribose synthase AbTIR-like n=1 Tax=Ptychodera flava TaxID=63121 RepID=UPI00396A2A02
MASETEADPIEDFVMNTLSANITQDDLTQMKRLCKGDHTVHGADLETAVKATDLLLHLKGDGNWSKDHVEFLVDLLTKANRVDLARELQQYWATSKGEESIQRPDDPLPPARRPSETPDYDVYISFAENDNNSFVQPLSAALKSCGCAVYLDCRDAQPSNEAKEKLTHILIKSKVLVFVISDTVITKGYWSKQELGTYIQFGIPIYPVWIGVTREQVKKFSPYLAGVLAEVYSVDKVITEEICLSLAKKIKQKVDVL